MAYAVRGRSSSLLGASVYRGRRDRPSLALTFDDGPSERTVDLLSLLSREGVCATFFLCGANVVRLPEVAREISAGGHEIGNHSHTHPLFCFRSPGFIESEFRRAQEAIEVTTGKTPKLLRAPFGVRWFGFRRMQRRLGLLGVMWTVIGLDWKLPAKDIVQRVAGRIGSPGQSVNGSIICLHDGRETRPHPDISVTLEAVAQLIPLFRERGFAFETVSQILCPTT